MTFLKLPFSIPTQKMKTDDLLLMHLHNENNIVIRKEVYGSPVFWGLHMDFAHTLPLPKVNLTLFVFHVLLEK